ncbi:hypothetical protein BG004_001567 [Podila humilis]|nr:hypothetical protein BG004_001567 [Podila humilis]
MLSSTTTTIPTAASSQNQNHHRSSIMAPSSIRSTGAGGSRLQPPKSLAPSISSGYSYSSSTSLSPLMTPTATTSGTTPTTPMTTTSANSNSIGSSGIPGPGFRKISVSSPRPVVVPPSFSSTGPTSLNMTNNNVSVASDQTHMTQPSSLSSLSSSSASSPTPSFTPTASTTATTTTTATTSASSSPAASSKTENVTVTVRIRPFSHSELKVAGGVTQVWEVNDESNIAYNDDYAVNTRKAAVDYAYDHALTGSDNELIYNSSVKNLVQSAMEGYNGTVFAYGQTSSGKTYTMSGTETQPGITPRAVEDVFKYIRENSEREFLLRVSYMEIYNESIRDLLSPEAIDLRIHEDKRRGVYVSPLKEEIVTTPIQVMRIIERGDYQRHVSSTDFNAHSSRSHSIFQITVESRERSPVAPGSPTPWKPLAAKSASAVRVSQLNLIDLAGSEKASSDIERRKEGAFINKSLLTLGTVISKLTEERGAHIPYRDSKLTRILQSSLNGSARVSVICTISPSYLNVEESNNTLKFAARVKKVVTKAQTNQVMDDKALLEKYRREISELKAQLMITAEATARAGASTTGSSTSIAGGLELDKAKQAELSRLLEKERMRHEEEMGEMNMVRNALKERIDHLTKLILTSQSINAKPTTATTTTATTNSSSSSSGAGTGTTGGGVGITTVVETSADGTVLEFPKEIESRLAQKDTIVRQLQNELETQQDKLQMVRTVLEKAFRGESVDLGKALAKLEQVRPQEKFLIAKRASLVGLNNMLVQGSGSEAEALLFLQAKNNNGSTVSSTGGLDDAMAKMSLHSGSTGAVNENDDDDDEDLMDTPWNRSELQSLRQAKRELEIIVMDQENKIEDLIALSSSTYSRSTTPTPQQQQQQLHPQAAGGGGANMSNLYQDEEEFKELVFELEQQRQQIESWEEEREKERATMVEMRNRMRRFEMENQQLKSQLQQGGGGARVVSSGYNGSPNSSSMSSSSFGSMKNGNNNSDTTISVSATRLSAEEIASLPPQVLAKVKELEMTAQKERRMRMEDQQRSMGRIASLEADLTIMKAQMSVQNLAGY